MDSGASAPCRHKFKKRLINLRLAKNQTHITIQGNIYNTTTTLISYKVGWLGTAPPGD